jgi:hypothetical protein
MTVLFFAGGMKISKVNACYKKKHRCFYDCHNVGPRFSFKRHFSSWKAVNNDLLYLYWLSLGGFLMDYIFYITILNHVLVFSSLQIFFA